MMDLEFYVLNENFNEKRIESFNIFRSSRFNNGVVELLNNFISFDNFVEELDKLAKYAFWSKAEYEIMVGDLFGKVEEKVDIYRQIKPNLKLIAKMIIDSHNENLSR